MNHYLRNAVCWMAAATAAALLAGFTRFVDWVSVVELIYCGMAFVIVALNLSAFHHERKANVPHG